MSAAAVEIRPARPGDLTALAAFIARVNAGPPSCSLHCVHATAAAIRSALRNAGDFPSGWAGSFMVGVRDDEIVAAAGWQVAPDGTLGWLWGPWLGDASAWMTLGPTLLAGMFEALPVSVRRVDAFLHVENRAGLRFLQSRGFSLGPTTHVYVVPAAGWTASAASPYPELRAMHEVAFARLHADTFPASGSTPAEMLLAGRDEEHAIFAASDGLRLLGSVCVSVNRAPHEGFIDYLAVKPTARGRGIGTRLLQSALHWVFETRRLPQAALTVSDWRQDAQRLYEQSGFALQASGIAARLKPRR